MVMTPMKTLHHSYLSYNHFIMSAVIFRLHA